MFFSKITTLHNPKNSLQTYLREQVVKLDGLNVEKPNDFFAHLHGLVLKANARYKRCIPLQVYLHKTYVVGDFVAGIEGLAQISLYHQKGVFSPQLVVEQTQSEGVQSTLFDQAV